MTPRLVLLASLLALGSAAVLKNGVTIATYAPVCHRSDPEFDQCLRSSLQTVLHKVAKKGIKGVAMPPLEPLNIPEYVGSFDGVGYSFKNIVRNVNFRGLGQTTFSKLKTDLSDPEDMNMDLEFFTPRVDIDGDYKVEGEIANVPVGGRGPFTLNITGLTGKMRLNAHLVEEEGETYMRVHRIVMDPDVKDMNFNFENLVDNNPELSQAANTFFKAVWRPVFEETKSYAREAFDKVFRHFVNQATLKIPFNQLLPL